MQIHIVKKKKSENKLYYILTTLITIALVVAMIFSYFYVENKNKETELILYNALNATNTETTPESGFIGNSKIQRQQQ